MVAAWLMITGRVWGLGQMLLMLLVVVVDLLLLLRMLMMAVLLEGLLHVVGSMLTCG